MKIKKFAGGGITYLPTTNRVAEETVKTTTASSEDSSKKSKVIDKLFDLIKEKGLDSDVAKFTNAIEIKLQMGLDPNGENLTQRDLVQLAQMASSVTTNYERYNTAVKNLTAQNAESDVAIDDRGRIYCYNVETKKVSALTPDKIKEQKDSIQILTNAELLNLRRSNSELAYNTKILDDINNAVGIDTITKYLQETIAKFKTSNVEGYSEKQQNAIASGLQALVGGDVDAKTLAAVQAGPDGVYKIKSTDTIADQNIKMALNYLQNTLPNKMKRKLETTAIVEGYDPSAFMITMLAANTERSFTANWEGQVDNDGKLSKKSASDSDDSTKYKDDALASRFSRGDLQQVRAYISPVAEMAGDTALMAVDAWNGYRPVTDDLKAIENTNVYDAFNYITQLKACDQSSITFGNQRISRNDLHGMILDENKNVMRMALPYKYDSDGAIVPDFDLLKKYNKVNRLVQDNPGMTKAEIKQRLGEELGDVQIDDNGKVTINPDKITVFGALGVIASDEIIKVDKDRNKGFIQRIDSNTGDSIKDEFNKLVQYGTVKIQHKQKPIYDIDDSGSNDFYYGWIYMPITDNTQAFGLTQNQLVPREDLMDVTKKSVVSNVVQQNAKQNPMRVTME